MSIDMVQSLLIIGLVLAAIIFAVTRK